MSESKSKLAAQVKQLELKVKQQHYLLSAMNMAATGVVTEEQIEASPVLSPKQKEDFKQMVRNCKLAEQFEASKARTDRQVLEEMAASKGMTLTALINRHPADHDRFFSEPPMRPAPLRPASEENHGEETSR